MRESLSFKNIFKREMKLASYIVICLTVVVLSLSYAMFFQVNNNTTNQEVVAGELKFTYTDGERITKEGKSTCFLPMNKDEANLYTNTCGYNFSVTNTGTLKASYTLKLTPNEENNIEDSKLKIILRKQVGNVYEEVFGFPKRVSELENGVLLSEEMDEKTTIVYNAQIYVDEEFYQDGDEVKMLSYQIEGLGFVHEDITLGQAKRATDYIKEIAKNDTINFAYDETEDHNLRYIGANPNNYIDIGDRDAVGNIIPWRIIGVMNNVGDGNGNNETRLKIIRSDDIGAYSWDTSASGINGGYGVNEWSEADLMKLLNPGYESESVGGSLYWNCGTGNCYNGTNNATAACDFTSSGLSNDTKSHIGEALWHIGSNGIEEVHNNILTSKFYELEKSNNTGKICTSGMYCNDNVERTTTWKGLVGLMSPADYGYATSGGNTVNRKTCLNTRLYDWDGSGVAECKNNDWLYNSSAIQWTITPSAPSSYASTVFCVTKLGNVNGSDCTLNALRARPVVYLKADTKIINGTGSVTKPYELM